MISESLHVWTQIDRYPKKILTGRFSYLLFGTQAGSHANFHEIRKVNSKGHLLVFTPGVYGGTWIYGKLLFVDMISKCTFHYKTMSDMNNVVVNHIRKRYE